jgi:hypothetical protein
MLRIPGALLAALALSALGLSTIAPIPAKAAVYCKAVGVPKGCVARPTGVVVTPVYCTAVGVPVGCVVRPRTVVAPVVVAPVAVAPVVVAPRARTVGVGVYGRPGNRGGPVNRVGRR